MKVLIAQIKDHLRKAAASERGAEKHYAAAGERLKLLKKDKPADVTWANYVRHHFNLSQQRADELIRIHEGRTTVAKTRAANRDAMRKSRAKQSTSRDVGQPPNDACNYDWENMKEEDFGSPIDAYKAKAGHYCTEAMHMADAFPLQWDKVDPSAITSAEIQRVRAVAQAWANLADTLTKRRIREVA